MAPREVFDTERQKQMRQEAIDIAAAARRRVAERKEAERLFWVRMLDENIAAIHVNPDDQRLRITFASGRALYIEPTEYAHYSNTDDYPESARWEDTTR
jgi:hypothetical protein